MTSSPTGYHTTPALHHMVVRVACATCHSALSFKGVVLPCSLHPGSGGSRVVSCSLLILHHLTGCGLYNWSLAHYNPHFFPLRGL